MGMMVIGTFDPSSPKSKYTLNRKKKYRSSSQYLMQKYKQIQIQIQAILSYLIQKRNCSVSPSPPNTNTNTNTNTNINTNPLLPDTEAELLRLTFPTSPDFGFVERPRGCNLFRNQFGCKIKLFFLTISIGR